jgi:hypothetical protein
VAAVQSGDYYYYEGNSMTRSFSLKLLILLLLTGMSLEVAARIKLITLPVRERVEIQLDHADVTLVEEERIVPLVQGINQVDFSWANTRIDPDTLVFRVVPPEGGQAANINVLSVSYPPGENALVWSISAAASGAALVRISYLLGGLDKTFHYRAVANFEETALTLSQYMRINNNANETFDEAQLWAGFGERFSKPIDVSETKEVLTGKFRDVPIEKTYTADPVGFGYFNRAQNKLNVPMHYVIRNDAGSGLGQAALPYGKARIFQQDGRGGSAFIGEDWGRFTPIDDELELYLGLARDIVVKRTIGARERRRVKGNLYDYEITVKYEIENFKDSPTRLRIVENLVSLRSEIIGTTPRDPQWALRDATTLQGPDPEDSDYQRLVFSAELPPRRPDNQAEAQIHELHLTLKNEW